MFGHCKQKLVLAAGFAGRIKETVTDAFVQTGAIRKFRRAPAGWMEGGPSEVVGDVHRGGLRKQRSPPRMAKE
eukprot:11208035-Lingulodinium_polyedra.AAC.1